MNRHRESFKYRTIASLGRKFGLSGTGNMTLPTTTSRRAGDPYLRLPPASGVTITWPAADKCCIGFAFRQETAFSFTWPILATNNAGASLNFIAAGAQATIRLSRSGITNVDSDVALLADTWYYLEWETYINSSGYSKLYIGGSSTPTLTHTGNTSAWGNISNTVLFNNGGGTVSFANIMDLYVNDGTGTYNTGRLGDRRVSSRLGTSDGYANTLAAYTAGSVDGSPANYYGYVDDATPDDDGTTLQGTSGKAMVGLDALAYTPDTIDAVGVDVQAKKADATTRGLEAVLYNATGDATDHLATLQNVDSTDYLNYSFCYERNPADSDAAFTKASLEELQFGIKVT